MNKLQAALGLGLAFGVFSLTGCGGSSDSSSSGQQIPESSLTKAVRYYGDAMQFALSEDRKYKPPFS